MKTYNLLLKDQYNEGWITFQLKANRFDITTHGQLLLVNDRESELLPARAIAAYNSDVWQSIEEVKE